MQETEGLTNVQNLPTTETDFDLDILDNDKTPPVPPDKQPSVAPIKEPPASTPKPPINEVPRESPRIMRAAAAYERRIF